MTNEEMLLSDLAEVSAELVDWAKRQIEDGKSADEVRAMLREAARLTGRA